MQGQHTYKVMTSYMPESFEVSTSTCAMAYLALTCMHIHSHSKMQFKCRWWRSTNSSSLKTLPFT